MAHMQVEMRRLVRRPHQQTPPEHLSSTTNPRGHHGAADDARGFHQKVTPRHQSFSKLWRRRCFIAAMTITLSFFLWKCLRFSIAPPFSPHDPKGFDVSSSSPYRYHRHDNRPGVYPRLVQCLLHDEKDNHHKNRVEKFQILDPSLDYSSRKHGQLKLPRWMVVSLQRKEKEDSRDVRLNLADAFETDDCKAQYSWQLATYPTCNNLHELDMTQLNLPQQTPTSKKAAESRVKHLSHGYWRDIWAVKEINFDEGTGGSNSTRSNRTRKVVLKTMRYTHDFSERNYDRHRRDALAAERLTRSTFVMDIFSFCGNSGIFEYGDGGDIADAIWSTSHNLTRIEKLRIATQAAAGLAAFHNVDKEGQASMAHTDISPGQFIKVGSTYKLNDFNRARFIRWNEQKNEPCGYSVDKNPGRNRSPEEYQYELQSEKVDVYSLGNIFYMLLQRDWPFSDVEEKKAQNMVRQGARPSFDAEVWNSQNSIDIALKEAMIMCHEQGPSNRATARQIETYLKGQYQVLASNTIT